MTSNGWFKKIKDQAQTVQGSAKKSLVKFTDSLDKKLKEAQDDLEKQRLKAESTRLEAVQQNIWRPSVENPDGAILTVTKPVPPALPAIPALPEIPSIPSPTSEPLTIPHTKGRRRSSRKNGTVFGSSSTLDADNESSREPKIHFDELKSNEKHAKLPENTIITEQINREQVIACLHELLDVIASVHELVENAVTIDTSEKDKLQLAQDLVDHYDIVTSRSNDEIIEQNELLDESEDQKNINEDASDDNHPSVELPKEEELQTLDSIPTEDGTPIAQLDFETVQKETVVSITTVDDPKNALNETQSHVEDDDENKTSDEPSALTTNNDILATSSNVDDEQSSQCTHVDTDPIEDELSTSTDNTEDISKTPHNELEDSFEKISSSQSITQQSTEEILQKSTSLAELRMFLAKIDNDSDADVELISTQYQTTSTDEVDSNCCEINDDISYSDDATHTSVCSNSPSIPSLDYVTTDSVSDDVFVDGMGDQRTSTITSEEKVIERMCFPLASSHSLPSGIKISSMTCSSTYIYVCTNNQKIFYAKIANDSDLGSQLQWQQHSDFAEQLAVSVSNRTVWRLYNKRLYSSIDAVRFPPIGSRWNEIKLDSILLSMSINDQCGWYIKKGGSLWFIRTTNNDKQQTLNVPCPFNLIGVFCFAEKVGVTASTGEIMIRVGCTNDCPEGDGWIFIDHNFGPIDDFVLLPNTDTIFIVDKQHRLWLQQCLPDQGSFEVLRGDDDDWSAHHRRHVAGVNSSLICLTDREEKLHIFSNFLTGIQWRLIQKTTRFQRLIGVFSNENHVWALNTDRMICTSNHQTLEKPRQCQYITHATFVPNNFSENTVLWSLDESCNIYVRPNIEINTQWEQLNQSQFEWSRRLVHMVCNHAGVWAVDDQGLIHFRHGHISASENMGDSELSLLPPAWITIPGEAKRHRYFSQVFCGPADWMVYATDNKQTVYARLGVNEQNRVGTSWKPIEDCSALELAVSERTLWLLTSCGEIQCRENISLTNPVGTRSITLPGHFLSLTVSTDDSQVWALDSARNLLRLDYLTVLFEK
ncbi:unnamed protein product [Adineta ricciae]|nr:unnamed protein product [Adineta ricciae]